MLEHKLQEAMCVLGESQNNGNIQYQDMEQKCNAHEAKNKHLEQEVSVCDALPFQ